MYVLETLPKEEADNEYATPCIYYFESMASLWIFVDKAMNNGEDIVVTIYKNTEME